MKKRRRHKLAEPKAQKPGPKDDESLQAYRTGVLMWSSEGVVLEVGGEWYADQSYCKDRRANGGCGTKR